MLKARRFEQQAEQDKVELPFSQVCEDFMRQWNAGRAGNKETNTEQQKRSTFALFAGFWDDKPIRGVTVSDGARFRDALKLFDPHWARSPLARLMSWAELLNRYGNRPRGLAAGTMNRHMAALQELWRWAYKRGHCARDNPFEGYHTKLRPGVNVSPYLAWEMDELRQLLSPPPRRSDLLEVMIVGMFTGMRLDEIASLTWDRIRFHQSQPVPIAYFQVEDAKTPAGNRSVPIHRSLAWLLARPRGDRGDRVWPGFNDEGRGKKPGADAGREFSRFKSDRGFKTRTKAFHSFRKNVTRMMERGGVPENRGGSVHLNSSARLLSGMSAGFMPLREAVG